MPQKCVINKYRTLLVTLSGCRHPLFNAKLQYQGWLLAIQKTNLCATYLNNLYHTWEVQVTLLVHVYEIGNT